MQDIEVYRRKGVALCGSTYGTSAKFPVEMVELSKETENGTKITYLIPKNNIDYIYIVERCQ